MPLFYVSGTQVNAQVPFDAPIGQAGIAIRRGSLSSAVRPVTVAAVSPGIFTVNQSGAGAGLIVHAGSRSRLESARKPGVKRPSALKTSNICIHTTAFHAVACCGSSMTLNPSRSRRLTR